MSNTPRFVFNGLNAKTGTYGVPPLSAKELAAIISGAGGPANLSELKLKNNRAKVDVMGPKAGVDPKKLSESGWGIVFSNKPDPKVVEALEPLIKRRKAQAGAVFHMFSGPAEKGGGVRKDETKKQFLARHEMGPGPAVPEKVPYYMLLVGSPEEISYAFQYELDVQYAVGRLYFDAAVVADPIQAYANYARSVVAAETAPPRPKEMAFFATANPNDDATRLSSTLLVPPLVAEFTSPAFQAKHPGWSVGSTIGAKALKKNLTPLLGGADTPAFLFTASHGLEFDSGDPLQFRRQGALICQDWAGPVQHQGEIGEKLYFSGDDLPAAANLQGLIAFFFACFGGGTPRLDDFNEFFFKQKKATIAPKPFVAALPQRMLGQAAGGALAVVGHVERAWTYSFALDNGTQNSEVFASTLTQLLDGHPIGSALEFMNLKYAELATELSTLQDNIKAGVEPDEIELALLWTEHNDARGYALFGDPGVRLVV